MRHHFQLQFCSYKDPSNAFSVARVKKDGTMMAKFRYSDSCFLKWVWHHHSLCCCCQPKPLLVKVWSAPAVKDQCSTFCFPWGSGTWKQSRTDWLLSGSTQCSTFTTTAFWNTTSCFHREGWASASQDCEQLLNQRLITQGFCSGTTHHIFKLF